nr:SCO2322 family protein [Actinacidiphila yeochonensis]
MAAGPVLAGLLAVCALLAAAAPASATGYRYWSYWLRSGTTWTYAQTGPAMHTPADGSVEGWRFAVSEDAAAKAAQPRGAADFATICGTTKPVAGHKRIALVIDAGTAADAPSGATPPAVRTACAQVATGASSADALAAVARPLRYDSAGVLCAISGYPRTGCGEEVSSSDGKGTTKATTTASPAGSDSGSGSGSGSGGPRLGLIAGACGVLVIALAGVWQTRRRRT